MQQIPASAKIYPWHIFAQPSKQTDGLVRLCLAHVEDCDAYFVVDVYDRSDLDSAALELTCAIIQQRSYLPPNMIQQGTKSEALCRLLNSLTPSWRSCQLRQKGTELHERRCIAYVKPGRKI